MIKPHLVPSFRPEQVVIWIAAERSELAIDDPGGKVGALIRALDGQHDLAEIESIMLDRWPDLPIPDVAGSISALDDAGLLEDAAAPTSLSREELERYRSNLAFFGHYARLSVSRFSMQERIARAKVILLGVGGVGSTVLMNLAGLGVGRIDIVDDDTVEGPNLVRQFLYREDDTGKLKVEAAAAVVRGMNTRVEVVPRVQRISAAPDLVPLLYDADLLVMAIDAVPEALMSVNEACVRVGVPFICGGHSEWGGLYYSVRPGVTGCIVCGGGSLQGRATRVLPAARRNAGTGPTASLVASFMSLEAMRYLSGFAEPVAAGRVWVMNFSTGELSVFAEWQPEPACEVCSLREHPAGAV